jgi:hypothetical protein
MAFELLSGDAYQHATTEAAAYSGRGDRKGVYQNIFWQM